MTSLVSRLSDCHVSSNSNHRRKRSISYWLSEWSLQWNVQRNNSDQNFTYAEFYKLNVIREQN